MKVDARIFLGAIAGFAGGVAAAIGVSVFLRNPEVTAPPSSAGVSAPPPSRERRASLPVTDDPAPLAPSTEPIEAFRAGDLETLQQELRELRTKNRLLEQRLARREDQDAQRNRSTLEGYERAMEDAGYRHPDAYTSLLQAFLDPSGTVREPDRILPAVATLLDATRVSTLSATDGYREVALETGNDSPMLSLEMQRESIELPGTEDSETEQEFSSEFVEVAFVMPPVSSAEGSHPPLLEGEVVVRTQRYAEGGWDVDVTLDAEQSPTQVPIVVQLRWTPRSGYSLNRFPVVDDAAGRLTLEEPQAMEVLLPFRDFHERWIREL